MQPSNRQNIIARRLREERGALSGAVVTGLFNVSVQTTRKDLDALSDAGPVEQPQGRITWPAQVRNLSCNMAKVINLQARQAVARQVAARIPESQS